MKKLLIGTTALVASGLVAGSAVAADLIPAPAPEIIDDGFTVSWNGYIRAGFYFGDETCSTGLANSGFGAGGAGTGTECTARTGTTANAVETLSTAVPTASELQLFAEQTLANGLRVGGEIDMDTSQGGVNIDEIWLFVDGHFGQVRVGGKEGALDTLGGGSLPSWGAFNGSTDGPDMNPIGNSGMAINGMASQESISGDNNKVTYLSPTIAGVNLAVSFAPDADLATNQTTPGTNGGAATTNGYNAEWGLAANTTHTIGAATLHVGGGVTFVEADKNNATVGDATIWKIAGSLTFANGAIGGFYSHREDDGIAAQASVNGSTGTAGSTAAQDKEMTVWGVLANIKHGDYTIGGGYTRSEDKKFNNVAGQNWSDDEADIWGFGVAKSMGTGVEIGANVTVVDATDSHDTLDATTAARTADGWLGGVYAAIAF